MFREVLVKYLEPAEQGLRTFRTRFGSLFASFSDFQTLFRIELKVFRGQFRSAAVPP